VLKPKELRFSGIGPFIEEQSVTFDDLGQLSQITGDSGAGKTSVLNAQEFLFGVNDLPNTVFETYLVKMPMSVSMDFDYDGSPLTITRAKNKLTINLNGEIISGSNKLAEEKLDEILGMPRELFRPLLLKRQKEGGFFLNFTPKEKYEFMSSALGLGGFQTKLEKIETKLSEIAKEKDKETNALSAAQTGLKATADALASLGEEPVQTVTQEAVLALKHRSDASSEQLMQMQLGHEAQLSILEQSRPKLQPPELDTTPFDGSSLALASAQKSAIEAAIKNLKEKETFRVAQVNKKIQDLTMESFAATSKISAGATAKVEATKVAAEIKKIRSGICSTCEQPWVHDSAKAKEAELMGRIALYRSQIETAQEATNTAASIATELAELKTQVSPQTDPELTAQVNNLSEALQAYDAEQSKKSEHSLQLAIKNKSTMEEFHARNTAAAMEFAALEKALRDKLVLETASLRELSTRNHQAFGNAYADFKFNQEAIARFRQSHGKLAVQFEEYSVKAAALELRVQELSKQVTVLEELKRAVKSFVSSKFDDALVSVADAATTMIRRIPNMANATIQLEGNRETKDGKIKEEVNAVIHKDGFENVHIKSLSGGERTSVDIAIDLAVIDFLEERTNKGIAIYNMDEPFVGLRSDHIEQILEMLQGHESNKRIILIDHNPIIEEFVSSKIRVSKNGTASTISLI
jgi:DNA repair exonuclease SbcCD ATPase subunit